MHMSRCLGATTGFLLMIGGIAPVAAADPENSIDVTTSRSAYLLLSDRGDAERVRFRDRRVRLRYDRPVEVGGNDYLLRFKATMKKKKLFAFEVIF